MHVFKVINYTTTNKFRFNSIFDISHLLPNTSTHFAIKIFSIFYTSNFKKMQDGVSAYSTSLNLHCTKAFDERHVIPKTKEKQNLLLVVIGYFKKVNL